MTVSPTATPEVRAHGNAPQRRRYTVHGVAEILGIDPLYIANEGKLVALVAAEDAERTLELMRSRPEGQEAAIIGEIRPEPDGMVFIRTGFGGARVVDMLIGDPLPRIC